MGGDALTNGWVHCPAPAKLNLFLHVTGRRADGYHLLQSAFRLIDWHDTVSLRVRGDRRVMRRGRLAGVATEDDLAVRAARLLQTRFGCDLGVELSIDKRLPMGGGLGGGSSDAATVLLALNRLWSIDADRAALMALGLELGADVPFFIFGRDALAEGVGEKLQELALPASCYVVVKPQVQVPTAAVFADPELTRNSAPIRMADFAASTTRNDLEAVVRLRYPEVDRLVEWLGQYAPARMTGSGACVFAPFSDGNEALRIAALCPAPWQARSVTSLASHPLREWVRD
ncbi:MAG: 4-(cytidine 5'-diphospho)-2-C-methyl-D-erythritol kinase [Rhodocyclaceae bacterium]|nr:4-(cytidine 5'-diphospho)-2-C-methyl-D-erythritol kinase [Rhodocyclaceae bacterium]